MSYTLNMHIFFFIFTFVSLIQLYHASPQKTHLSCTKCIHYNANPLNSEFLSPLNICNKFGINVLDCRKDEKKCGFSGKEWKKEPKFISKLFWFSYQKHMLIMDSKKNNIAEKRFQTETEIKKIVDQFIEIMDAKVSERKDL